MFEKETAKISREMAKNLNKKLQEIDPNLLVILATGNPSAIRRLPVAATEPLSPSILNALPADGWEQKSWHDVWKDSGGWTDVWGQSPGPKPFQVQAPIEGE